MGWFQKLIYGVDLEAEQKRSDDLDAKIKAENEHDYGPGGPIYNQTVQDRGVAAANQQWEEVQARQKANQIDVQAEVDDAFNTGLKEGYDNVTGGIKDTLAAPFKFTFAALPWQIWVVGLIVLFLYLGGGQMLKGILNRR